MPRVARLGDSISHGGSIITASADVMTNGPGVARVGDLVNCIDHGIQSIVQGSDVHITDSPLTARVGDMISCGATIVQGSEDREVGDTTGGSYIPPNSNLFTKTNDVPVGLPTSTNTSNSVKQVAYIKNPAAFYNKEAAEGGVKADYPGTPETIGQTDPEPPKTCINGHASTVLPFLQKCLGEASTGIWRETGQGGKQSNPNILKIWKSLGYPSSGVWLSDQTAWCAGFVNWALKESGLRYLKEAGARATINRASEIGYESVPIASMQAGDIVLWSYSHVNFCYTANNGKFTFVGGNQTPDDNTRTNNPSDGSVSISWKSGWTVGRGQVVSVIRPKC